MATIWPLALEGERCCASYLNTSPRGRQLNKLHAAANAIKRKLSPKTNRIGLRGRFVVSVMLLFWFWSHSGIGHRARCVFVRPGVKLQVHDLITSGWAARRVGNQLATRIYIYHKHWPLSWKTLRGRQVVRDRAPRARFIELPGLHNTFSAVGRGRNSFEHRRVRVVNLFGMPPASIPNARVVCLCYVCARAM